MTFYFVTKEIKLVRHNLFSQALIVFICVILGDYQFHYMYDFYVLFSHFLGYLKILSSDKGPKILSSFFWNISNVHFHGIYKMLYAFTISAGNLKVLYTFLIYEFINIW